MISLLACFLPLALASEPTYKNPRAPLEARIADLIHRMTVAEKARQLDMYSGTEFVDHKLDDTHAALDANAKEDVLTKNLGSLGAGSIHDLYPSPRLTNSIQRWVIGHNRLGIPALFIEEGVHGYLGFGYTVYPCSINLAATFDKDLSYSTAGQIASEARSDGIGMLLGPVLDVAREPRWGRIEEDFGEDPYLTGEMGASYVEGMQGVSLNTDHSVISEPKHFAGHGSPEGGTNTSPVHAGEREVRSVFLRSFQPAIEKAGARGVMAAYHEIDGVPCAGNPWLLTDVLRGEWGFKGFVLSDLGAINELYSRHHVAATEADAVRLAVRSGVDMQFYDFGHDTFQNALVDGVKNGSFKLADLDRAASRVLRVKFELGLFDHPFVDETLHPKVVRSPEHLETSLRSARESICLLRNENHLLPLSPQKRIIAVIGPNATTARTGDYTAAQGVHPISILDGIKSVAGAASKVISSDGADIAASVALANQADVVVLGLGESDGISGEGSDRSSLDLPGNQEALLEAIASTNKPIVLVLENGRPLSVRWASTHVPAILEAWYPGEFGGTAIAEILFGSRSPSGHLPISIPASVGAIPDFYNHDPSKGDRYVEGSAPSLWPFGYGLSYSDFTYSNLTAVPASGGVDLEFDVKNTGRFPADTVAQVYERPETSSVETPVRSLKAFRRVALPPGGFRHLKFHLGKYELEIWGSQKKWTVEPGEYQFWVGDSSRASLSAKVKLR